MKSVLLYFPFEMAENANSGSKLRPKEIFNAFKRWGEEEGIEILLLSGNSADRKALFGKWKDEGKLDELEFCYMENQTIPIWLTDKGHIPKEPFIDQKVMKFLKKRNVPTGVFYRDVYWKFDELYPLKGVKKAIMQRLYKFEEKFYQKYCDVIFLPSDAMGNYVDINRKKIALPPGGKERAIDRKPSQAAVRNGLYVGGINNEDYGLFLLLEAIEIANQQGKICELTVVCRKEEYLNLPEEKKDLLAHTKVEHVSGEALNDLYMNMDFAFIPRYRSEYNDFSVPVKLVEYLSNELPVIATNCSAQEDIIESGEYGIICKDQAEDMAAAIKDMCEDSERYRTNIQSSFMMNHSWEARVKKIKSSLVRKG